MLSLIQDNFTPPQKVSATTHPKPHSHTYHLQPASLPLIQYPIRRLSWLSNFSLSLQVGVRRSMFGIRSEIQGIGSRTQLRPSLMLTSTSSLLLPHWTRNSELIKGGRSLIFWSALQVSEPFLAYCTVLRMNSLHNALQLRNPPGWAAGCARVARLQCRRPGVSPDATLGQKRNPNPLFIDMDTSVDHIKGGGLEFTGSWPEP